MNSVPAPAHSLPAARLARADGRHAGRAAAIEGNVKGRLIAYLESFARAHEGDAAWQRTLAMLTPEDMEPLQEPLIANAWYPVRVWNHALSSYIHVSGAPAAGVVGQLAHYVASQDLGTLFKLILRAGSPELVLKRTDSLYKRYFDTGQLESHELKPRLWQCELVAPSNLAVAPGALTCNEGICSWIRRALELTSTRATVEHKRCRFHGAASCLYEIRW